MLVLEAPAEVCAMTAMQLIVIVSLLGAVLLSGHLIAWRVCEWLLPFAYGGLAAPDVETHVKDLFHRGLFRTSMVIECETEPWRISLRKVFTHGRAPIAIRIDTKVGCSAESTRQLREALSCAGAVCTSSRAGDYYLIQCTCQESLPTVYACVQLLAAAQTLRPEAATFRVRANGGLGRYEMKITGVTTLTELYHVEKQRLPLGRPYRWRHVEGLCLLDLMREIIRSRRSRLHSRR